MSLFGKKKKVTATHVAIGILGGSVISAVNGFISGYTSEIGKAKAMENNPKLGMIEGFQHEHGKARAIYQLRKKDPNYGYPVFNFIAGVTEDDIPDEYADGQTYDLQDAFEQIGLNINIDDDDEEEDDEEIVEEETEEQPPKMKPKNESKK